VAGARESRDPAGHKHVSSSATRRVCALCGRMFALVLPPGEPETERDRFCPDCLALPEPPQEDPSA
jgi:hypothetical protein